MLALSAKPSVLIVEDDEAMRSLVSDALQRDGYQVLEAASVVEARGCLAIRGVDLVLSDVHLGGPSGLDLGRTLLETPLILMTAFPSSDVEAAAREMQATLLPKPFRIEVLRRAVLTTIARRIKRVACGD